MKAKLLVFAGMAAAILAVCLFSNLDGLPMDPLVSPEAFLASMPYSESTILGWDFIFIQPSSSLLVYALGLVMIALGIYFLVTTRSQKSRWLWGIGLVLWGASAIVAGSSYQAFGYELKCRGQAWCLYTNNFELVYMLLTAFSINFLVAATGYTSLGLSGRKRLLQFAVIDSLAYWAYLLIGAVIPVKFLISYEGFMAFIGVNFLLMFILNVRHYQKYRDPLNRNLVIIWIGFLLVNVGYFIFLLGRVGQSLYENSGIWFNENDVLHILLILWAVMIFFLLKTKAVDASDR